MDSTITLSDGRRLDLSVSGPDDGLTFVFHHGTPGARVPEGALEQAAHARGLRYVGASRPGYGSSSRRPGRQVVDVVADSAAILAELGVSECVVAGHSGGGPHALACAAGLPGVRATLVIAGVAPYDAAGLDFLAGMGEDNLEEFDHAIAGEAPLRAFLESVRPQLLGADARQLTMMLESLLPEIDRATLRDPAFGAETVAMFAEGLREGVDGWVDDDLAFVKPWGFALADIASPVTLWQGDVDLMVPFAHGQWLAGAIPGADVHLLPGEGHLSVAVGSAEAMLDALLALA